MSKSCKGLLKELVKCLRETDCMQKVGWVCTGGLGPVGVWSGTLARHPVALSLASSSLNPWANHPDGNVQEGKPIRQCAQEAAQCNGLRNAYTACKRGQMDARSRLRGNKGY